MSAEPYSYHPHSFIGKIVSWSYCADCGLIRLKNPLTQWCVDKGCNYADHPQYRAMIHKFTDPFRRK